MIRRYWVGQGMSRSDDSVVRTSQASGIDWRGEWIEGMVTWGRPSGRDTYDFVPAPLPRTLREEEEEEDGTKMKKLSLKAGVIFILNAGSIWPCRVKK